MEVRPADTTLDRRRPESAPVMTARLPHESAKLIHDLGVQRDREPSRRKDWRGDRKAVLIRLPVDLAVAIENEAVKSGVSMSDVVDKLIRTGLQARRDHK